MRLAIIFCFITVTCSATNYWVRVDGNNSNTGLANDSAHAWLTLAKAATILLAGDTVNAQAGGTFDEQVSLTHSGSTNSFINWVGNGAICRGFVLTDMGWNRIINFEITQTNTSFLNGVLLNNTCTNIEIIDNYIHDIKGAAVVAGASGAFPSFITVRGNNIDFVGHVSQSSYLDAGEIGIGTCFISPHHWLVEYNTMRRCPEAFFDCFGTNIYNRNNYAFDTRTSYWANTTFHPDVWQEGSDGVAVGTRFHVVEANQVGDCPDDNAHIGIWQDNISLQISGDTNIIFRGNVAYNFGNGGIASLQTKKLIAYQNTFSQITNGPAMNWFMKGGSTNFPDGALGCNNIIDSLAANSSGSIHVDVGTSDVTVTNNLGFQCPAHASFVSTADPKFVDPTSATRNFRLQAGSPAINTGTNFLKVTTASGSGTSFAVNDATSLCDGWNMVDGDTITIGSTNYRITSISGNTVTVTPSATWTLNQAVIWGKYGTNDIGALPFASVALTAANLTTTNGIYYVTTTGDARGVWFYTNGIPATWVSCGTSNIASTTLSAGPVTAKAYALYAQSIPVVKAVNNLTISKITTSGGVIIRNGSL